MSNIKISALGGLGENGKNMYIVEVNQDIFILDAEPFGPSKYFDIIVIAPLTGTSLSKLANGITDNAVLMAAKGLLRNQKPVVLGVSTNDALGINGVNLMKLMASKNFYFIPLGQDDPKNKPTSMIADFSILNETVKNALDGKQIQPVIISKIKS